MMTGIFLGIDSILLHLLLFQYLETRKKKYLLFISLSVGLACICGEKGIALCIASFISEMVVYLMTRIARINSPIIRYWVSNRFLLISVFVFMVLVTVTIYNAISGSASYGKDVFGAYISNLYGTKRFSAMPFFSISIMHFIYLCVFIYILIIRKQQKRDGIFVAFIMTAILYIIAIGVGYIRIWASNNLMQNGEYMTGFGNYMLPVTILLYGLLLYLIVAQLGIKKKK